MSQILFDFLEKNDNASIVLDNSVIITSVKVITGSHIIMKLKFAERRVTKSILYRETLLEKGGGGGGGCL